MHTDKTVFRIFNHYDMIKNIPLYINNYHPVFIWHNYRDISWICLSIGITYYN